METPGRILTLAQMEEILQVGTKFALNSKYKP